MLLKELFPETTKEVAHGLVDNKIRKIVNKGTDISTVDLYNLCLLNKEREEIEKLANHPNQEA